MNLNDDNQPEMEIPGELVEKIRRESKKDHSRDRTKVDELDRKRKNSHKRRIAEIREMDLEDEEDEYSHLWK
jgi:hypothetical protein